MHKLLTAVCLLLALTSTASALMISSSSPGNIFPERTPIDLAIKDTQGAVSYTVTDYFGKKVGEGTASDIIRLPGQKSGWYELTCTDSAGSVSASIGVLMDRKNAPLPADGRVCVDVAAAWLVKDNQFKPIAKMTRMAGIPWVRERLSWADAQASRGRFDWGKYSAVANAFAGEGIHVCQLWHNCPTWARADQNTRGCPDDLRDVYNFSRAAASRFSSIEAWEVWNEVDADLFWPELSDRYSGLLKAAYLGIKDGNPQALVLQASLCMARPPFQDNLYESGGGDYLDIFNWHTYSPIAAYQGQLQSYLAPLAQRQMASRPIWMTEAGIRLPRTDGHDKHLLDRENQRLQCRFMPRSAVMSLAAGSDRNFFFVLPDYIEGSSQFGALHPDLTPYPSFVALSAAANILGKSTYKGRLDLGNNVVAQLFSTPRGNVLIAWSDTDAEIAVPIDKGSIRAADIFGNETNLAAENGIARLKVGPDAIYLLDIGKSIEKNLTGKPRPRGRLPILKPSRVIVAAHADLPIQKSADRYLIAGQKPFDYTVEVYNFNDSLGTSGTVELIAPAGWTVGKATRMVKLGPLGRQVVTYQVTPGPPKANRLKLTVRARFGRERVTPCISCFGFDPSATQPAVRKPLDWAADPERWKPQASANGSVTLSKPEAGTLRFDAAFTSEGDRWAYPSLTFDRPADLSGFDGIAFDLDVRSGDPISYIRLMLVERNGGRYLAATSATPGRRRVAFLFREMELLEMMGPDPNGRLDIDAISAVKLGCNTSLDHLVFDASGFELVKY